MLTRDSETLLNFLTQGSLLPHPHPFPLCLIDSSEIVGHPSFFPHHQRLFPGEAADAAPIINLISSYTETEIFFFITEKI